MSARPKTGDTVRVSKVFKPTIEEQYYNDIGLVLHVNGDLTSVLLNGKLQNFWVHELTILPKEEEE